MPTWAGWNEQVVRQKRFSADSSTQSSVAASFGPITTGFTAVNAHASGLRQSTGNSQLPDTGSTNGEAIAPSSTEPQTKTVASEYLGRDDPAATVPFDVQASGALHGRGTKKGSNSAKKRKSSTTKQTSSKRRKISDVSNGMPITKSTDRPKASASKSNPRGGAAAAAESRASNKPARNALASSMASGATALLSVFAPSTSMDTLNTASHQTSVDALKTSAGHGTTLYRSNQIVPNAQTTAMTPQSLLNPQTLTTDLTNPSHASNTRILRPHKASTTQKQESPPLSEKSNFHASVKASALNISACKPKPVAPQKQNGSRNTLAPKRQPRTQSVSRKPSKLSDEDFVGDDDSVDQALALGDSIEAETKPRDTLNTTAKGKSYLPTPVNSDASSQNQDMGTRNSKRRPTPLLTPDEEFVELDEEDEAEIVDLTEAAEEAFEPRPPTPPPRERKLNMREVDKNEDYGGALFSDAERQLLDSLKATNEDTVKPIVRKPFPTPVLDRSPVLGATNTTILRTCFRVGEALKEGSQAARSNQRTVILELYARVTSSYREQPAQGKGKQYFVFKDLFHDHPPFLEGTFGLWDQSRLWELDARAFLGRREGGVMCRCIAKMKREGSKWVLEVVGIWEAAWEDVEYAAGIYAKEGEVWDD